MEKKRRLRVDVLAFSDNVLHSLHMKKVHKVRFVCRILETVVKMVTLKQQSEEHLGFFVI